MYAIGKLVTDVFGRDKDKKKELLREMGYTNLGKGFSNLDKLIKEGSCSKDFGENLIKTLGTMGFDSETVEGAFKETDQQLKKEREDYERGVFKPYLYIANEREHGISSFMQGMLIQRIRNIRLPMEIADHDLEEQKKIVQKTIKEIKPGDKADLIRVFGNITGYIYRQTYDNAYLFGCDGKFIEQCNFKDHSLSWPYSTI